MEPYADHLYGRKERGGAAVPRVSTIERFKCTVKPLNKGHIGDNINSAVLSFIERLSSFRGSQCIKL